MRRAASYSDFYHVVKAQLSKDGQLKRKKKAAKATRNWDALMLSEGSSLAANRAAEDLALSDTFDERLLEASQQEYLCVRDSD